jgi:polysaccharide export outer membrane protein
MFFALESPKRAFSTLFLLTLQVSIGLITSIHPINAQTLPSLEPSVQEFTAPPENSDSISPRTNEESLNDEKRNEQTPSEDIAPEFNRYLLDTGDGLSVIIQPPTGLYRLGIGDSIGLTVERFPDLNFQGTINREGKVLVPLVGFMSLKGLTLQEAQAQIRVRLDRYVVDPVAYLSLVGQRPNLSFQAAVDQDGNIIVPQIGQVNVKGLTVVEAQEKIRLALSPVNDDPVVVSLAQMRPVKITISGEVFRPGIYSGGTGMLKITDILPLAGGSTLNADLRKVQVLRRSGDGSIISQNVDLYAALQSGASLPSLQLHDGDAIIIQRREPGTDDGYDRRLVARSNLATPQIKVRVLNYAAGGITTQSIPNGSTFLDVLGNVPLNTANLRDIALVRFDPDQGKAVTQRLDAKKALAGDAAQNVTLQDNDVIVVGRNLIGRLNSLLSTITQPYFNVQSFIRFFENFGSGLFGGSSNQR